MMQLEPSLTMPRPYMGATPMRPSPLPDEVAPATSAAGQGVNAGEEDTAVTDRASSVGEELSPEQQQALQQLQDRDREVRAHEAAHMAAAAGLVRGGMSFSYQNGPDGRRYAVGGEVSIDSSPVPDDPQATLQKAQQIQAAALAPATPSAQDRAVAASAAQMALEARVELAQQRRAEVSAVQNTSQRDALSAYRAEPAVPSPSLLDQIA